MGILTAYSKIAQCALFRIVFACSALHSCNLVLKYPEESGGTTTKTLLHPREQGKIGPSFKEEIILLTDQLFFLTFLIILNSKPAWPRLERLS